ncbi:hypothetical protein [Pseudalkalibacillus caeni]|uniref:LysM domain-containing protein n=1 Tax=Exobacillus caeni TaxID=2574798 RepID=A0A5R9F645_9BACL|nr:hypothetical protein [Pseudalkalibacillus caeni]TLS36293.1 hypothetical protein FCL54_15250 [Pseudalkalibacillus caeni]
MKRFIITLLIFAGIYTTVYDLKVGTLTLQQAQATNAIIDESNQKETEQKFTEVQIKSGDTVLSVVEQMVDGPLPVSIDRVVQDFKKLNDDLQPEKIQIGKSYRIPVYSK